MYELLGNPFRRALVAAEGRLDAPASLSRTAEAVTDALTARTDLAPVAADATTLELQLHHTHLPKLNDAGVLTYDAARQTVVDVDDDAMSQLTRASEALIAECGDALAVE